MASNPPSALDQLRKAVISQKTALLPDEAPSPALQTLHQTLYDYDHYVSEMVIAVLQGSDQGKAYPHQDLVEEQMANVIEHSDDRRSVELYRRYKERLDKMQALALAVAAER